MGTKNTALRDLLADVVGDNYNNGTLVIGTTGMALTLATFTLPADAFGASATGVITLLGVPDTVSAANTGAAAEATLNSSGSTYTVTGLTVATSSADVIIDNTSIVSGQNVTLNSCTWTESASTAAP